MAALRLSDVAFTPAPARLRETGLLGWVRATLDDRLRLDGLAVRRTADGPRTVTFPTRIDGRGREHTLVWPLDDATRRQIQGQILASLDAQGVLS